MADTYFKSRMLYKKRRRKKLRPIFLFPVVVVLLVGGMWYAAVRVVSLEYWQVRNISVTGPASIEQDELYALVQESLDGRAIGFIPKSQYFFVSGDGISSKIKKKFPNVRHVSVTKTYPDAVSVIAEERLVFGIYCVYERKGSSTTTALVSLPKFDPDRNTPCFYVDREGVIFESVSSAAGRALPIIHSDESENFVEGESTVPTDLFGYFEKANDALKNGAGFSLVSITVSRDVPKDFVLGTNFGWFIAVPRAVEPEEWVETLKAVIETKIRTRLGELEYMDMRYGSKVFYKYK